MPRRSRLKRPPLDLGGETFGQRLARIRRERGYTQTELAEKVGLIQVLVSDYERGKLRLTAEMVVRFSLALGVSTDELLGVRSPAPNGKRPPRRILRRLQRVEELPQRDQEALIRTLDAFLGRATRQT